MRRTLQKATAENVAEQVLTIAGSYSHILAPATAYGKNIFATRCSKLDVTQISEITKVESADTFQSVPIYAGNAIATVQSSDAIKVITVRTTGFDAAATGGSAAVESVAPQLQTAASPLSYRAKLQNLIVQN